MRYKQEILRLTSQNDITIIITNTILWGDTAPDGAEISSFVNSYPDIAYSDIQGGYSGSGNIDQDPGFVDPAGGDFHLAPGSPCIDAGDPDAPSLHETDFEGDPRIVGDFPDMGVDEFVAEEGGDVLEAYVLYAKDKVKLERIGVSIGDGENPTPYRRG